MNNQAVSALLQLLKSIKKTNETSNLHVSSCVCFVLKDASLHEIIESEVKSNGNRRKLCLED